jgi:TatD DNase family protein
VATNFSQLLINIHSHHAPGPNEWALQNLSDHYEKAILPGNYSIGIHPWFTNEKWQEQLNSLKEWSQRPNVKAIGECGLDKLCSTNFSLQQEVFMAQVKWANSIGRPLIIHCVKAWEEVLQVLLDIPVKVPVIFHGFNNNVKLMEKITGRGFYISLGKSLYKKNIQELLPFVPSDRFFLETDDAALSIQDVYEQAALALSIDHNSLSLQLEKNAAAVFGAAAIIT